MKSYDRLAGKVAVVTGSTKGLGKAVATIFAREGAKVVVSGRDAAAGAEVVAAITAEGGTAIFHAADVAVEADVAALMKRAEDEWGRLDILVNNAAPSDFIAEGGEHSVVDMPTENWDFMYRVVCNGTFWGCKYAIPIMKRGGGGSITNISSSSSWVGLERLSAYSSAKGAINALTRQVAVEFGRDGIRVNALIIGFIPSGSNASMLALEDPVTGPAVREISLTRMGRPEDVGYVCTFLASDEAEFITGIEMPVDGGMLIQPVMAKVRGPEVV